MPVIWAWRNAQRSPAASRTLHGMWPQSAGRSKPWRKAGLKELTLRYEKAKAQVRARVEHPFHVVKNLFRPRKVRYRGLAKNTAQLQSLFALANLFLARRSLLAPAQA